MRMSWPERIFFTAHSRAKCRSRSATRSEKSHDSLVWPAHPLQGGRPNRESSTLRLCESSWLWSARGRRGGDNGPVGLVLAQRVVGVFGVADEDERCAHVGKCNRVRAVENVEVCHV